jgi:hypothetical protein
MLVAFLVIVVSIFYSLGGGKSEKSKLKGKSKNDPKKKSLNETISSKPSRKPKPQK